MDISDTSVYYYNAACWAYDNGITTQLAFKPNSLITREQAITFVYRYAVKLSKEEREFDLKAVEDCVDYEALSMWSVKPMAWALSRNLVNLTKEGELNPIGLTLGVHAGKLLGGFLGELNNITD